MLKIIEERSEKNPDWRTYRVEGKTISDSKIEVFWTLLSFPHSKEEHNNALKRMGKIGARLISLLMELPYGAGFFIKPNELSVARGIGNFTWEETEKAVLEALKATLKENRVELLIPGLESVGIF